MKTKTEMERIKRKFFIFGFTTKNIEVLKSKISVCINAEPRIIPIKNRGHFFLCHSYGDIFETPEMIAVKLGFIRSVEKQPLSQSMDGLCQQTCN